MSKGSFHHLTIFILAVCAWFSLPPAARADGPTELVLVESTDVGTGRPNHPATQPVLFPDISRRLPGGAFRPQP